MRLSVMALLLYSVPWMGCDRAPLEPEPPVAPPPERAPAVIHEAEPFAPGTIFVDARRALG